MRHTGDASTSLGNVVVNMLINLKFHKKNKKLIIRGYFLGDDLIDMLRCNVNLREYARDVALNWNMISKPGVSKEVAKFLQCMVYK